MFKRLQIILIAVALSKAMVSQYYKAILDFDDKLTVVDPLKNTTTNSLVSCAILCGSGCAWFSFNVQTMMCLLFSSLDPSNMTVSQTGWKTFIGPVLVRPKDCLSVYNGGQMTSGVYTIYPYEKSDPDYRPVKVVCDMDTEGGGWTIIQKRVDGSGESFNRSWKEYKSGFGSPPNDYWIGNDVIHQLTKGQNSSLYIKIQMFQNFTTLYQMYGQFSVSGEDSDYTLYLAEPGQGTLGDEMVNTITNCMLSGMKFTTWDRDNHNISDTNCAFTLDPLKYFGGWWFNNCDCILLNGGHLSSILWNKFLVVGYDKYWYYNYVNSTVMMIKSN